MRPRNQANILIAYSSTHGQTLKICQRLRSVIEKTQQTVTLLPISETAKVDLFSFDKIVVGASIHYGHHQPEVHAFIDQHAALLDSKPNAFFSVNVVARKPGKNSPKTNPYLKKFLKRINWKPRLLAVFAGKIDYPAYKWFDRTMIRLIMWITKGPTAPDAVIEFTDWQEVDHFGQLISYLDTQDEPR